MSFVAVERTGVGPFRVHLALGVLLPLRMRERRAR